MRTDSDIDILLIHPDDADIDVWTDRVVHLQRLVASWTGNDTRVLAFSEFEARKHIMSEPVLREIAQDGIGLIGPTNWLRRVMTRTS
jgi:hypothetical protein